MTAIRETLERSGNGRYSIDDEIGRGGMATVYRAHDLKHDRIVALKVVRPDISAGLTGDRFLRETRLVARLQHPHIVPLYDSGDAEGLLWFAMPYIEGESLRQRMHRAGRLGTDDVIQIGRQVADALDYAHRSGIVHRDIKPENILLSDRHAYVADFGIAAGLAKATGDAATRSGPVVGTPAYMSPEQSAGEDIDGRSDVYSLGCVLYEMVAGRRPHDGPTVVAILARRLCADPTPLRELRPDVPAALEQVIARALMVDTGRRTGTAAELRDRLIGAPSVTVPVPTVSTVAAIPSIAVLPFANMSADPDNEYFSDGMAEELINALTRLGSLKVAARTSSFAFRNRNVDLREVGRVLGVSTVLEGSIRRAGNQLRVTAQLIDVEDGFHLWSERFDREMDDVFEIQDEIAAAIVAQLEVRLNTDQAAAPLVRRGTEDLEAYHLYHRGRYHWERRSLQKSLESFEGAIARDPDYALPLAGLADGYSLLAYYGFMPSLAARARATEAARRAVRADDDLAEAHVAAAGATWFFEYDTVAAESGFRRAVSLNPRSAYAHAAYAFFCGVQGRSDDVAAHGRRGLDLDVLSSHVARLVGLGHVLAGDHDTGIDLCRAAVDLDPDSAVAVFSLGFARAQKGQYAPAIQALEKAIALSQPSPLYAMALGYTHALAGESARAEAIIAGLESRSLQPYCAWIHAALGNHDAAFQSLERLFEQRNPIGFYFTHWPGWASLRAEPEYTAIVTRTGLEHTLHEESGLPSANMAPVVLNV